MSANNNVTQVVFLPNEAPVAAAARITALANGNWGVYDYDTGLSIDPASAVPARFIIAYRGDGTLGEAGKLYQNAGTHIQTDKISNASFVASKAAVGQALELQMITAQSGVDATNYDYGVKLEFRGNTDVYQRYGANQASKVFMANTSCVGKVGASSDAGSEVIAQLVGAIANDVDQFLSILVDDSELAGTTKTLVFVPGTGWENGDGVAKTEEEALTAIRAITSNDTVVTISVVTKDIPALTKFCGINPKYFKQRQFSIIPSLIGENCNWADFNTSISMVYEIGLGYDIQELEYVAQGFGGQGSPYRQSGLHGLPFAKNEFVAIKTTKYDVYSFQYMQFSVAGWLEHLNHQTTHFILPDTNTTVKAALDAIIAASNAVVTTLS